MRLRNKLAAVTGSSSGIGLAIAQALAAEGAAVVSLARRFTAKRLDTPPSGGAIAEVSLDVTREDDVAARFAELPRLDVLVCAAGVATYAPVTASRVADLRAMLEVHVVGTFLCARAAMTHMVKQGAGHIVGVSSVAAQRAFSDCSGYTAAKAGQLGLLRVLAEEARPHGVRVTTLLPGATDTPIWDSRVGFDRSRMMRPSEVAGAIVDVIARPEVAIEELVVMPPRGAL